jgi:hypothetical protein
LKITFSGPELSWLHTRVNNLLSILMREKQFNAPTIRILKKMQYKFSPNASYTNLTRKEAGILTQVATHHLGRLKAEPMQLSDDIPLIEGLLTKMENTYR